MTSECMSHPETVFFLNEGAKGVWRNPGEIRQDLAKFAKVSLKYNGPRFRSDRTGKIFFSKSGTGVLLGNT